MDIASIVGFLLAWAMMACAVMMGGGSVVSFWDTASILVVLGGFAAAVLMCFPLSVVLKTPAVIRKCFFNTPPNVPALIQQIVRLSDIARRDGLLALEARLEDINNPFIKLGVQLAVDGTRPEVVQEVLQNEIDAMSLRHKEGKSLLDKFGKYAPAYGMIGTLLGLIMMLGNMSDPSGIGGGMAVALITTLYGAVLSNASFLPLAEKLHFVSRQEIVARDIIIKGILAIQNGENPRIIEQKLNTYLPPHRRPKEDRLFGLRGDRD